MIFKKDFEACAQLKLATHNCGLQAKNMIHETGGGIVYTMYKIIL